MTRAKTSLPPELDVDLRLALNKAIRQSPLVLRADTVLALIAPVIDRFVREAKAEEMRRIVDLITPADDAQTVIGMFLDRAEDLMQDPS